MVVELTQVPETQVGSDVKRIARVELLFFEVRMVYQSSVRATPHHR